MVDLLDDDGLLDIGSGTDPARAVRDLRPRKDMPESNAALRAWAGGQDGERKDLCHLCGKPPRLVCQACRRPACSADSWVMLSLCRTCATEERMQLWHERNRNVSDNWLEP